MVEWSKYSEKKSTCEKSRPTQRALDAGVSAHIPSSFLRLSLFPLGRGSPVRPSASNANRWAALFQLGMLLYLLMDRFAKKGLIR
jgi:hypothetical protein